ncbi:MAG TPA: helix-turn-helix transcriptional regulator [Dongiaceae bacterium]|nr:helix-turn-helix transcriptional regulator [Dongiaceae bacterium]
MLQRSHLAAPEFAAWNAAAVRLAEAGGAAAIGDALTGALKIVLDFDGIFVAALHRDAPPSVPYYNDPYTEPGLTYHDGPYLLDPFYNHFLAGVADGCYRLAELAPEGFLRSEYFASYYRLLDYSDELGLLAALGAGSCAHVSVARRGGPRFTKRDRDWLAAAAPLAREAVQRMNKADSQMPGARSALHDSLRQAHRHFGASLLTEREREVVQLLLRGNSAKAIARVLVISPETARNHLKRIYPKLGVASQAELFALFFRSLEQVEPGFEGDPLTRLR